jgi:peroxiredoxin
VLTEADTPKIEPGLTTPPELDADQMVAITVAVAAVSKRALRAGTMAPAFHLRDFGERQVSLQELSATGPAIVHFYRGSWCTYCQNSLTDPAAAHDDIRAACGRLVAIAPPPSLEFRAGARQDAARLPYTTLIDHGMKVAVAYGVAYSLPAQLRPIWSIWEAITEHWQTALRLRTRRLILEDVPVFGQHPVGDAHDVGSDPVSRPSHARESPMDDDKVALGYDHARLVPE